MDDKVTELAVASGEQTRCSTYKDYMGKTATLTRQRSINDMLSEIIGAKYDEYRRRWEAAGRMEYEPEFPLFVNFEYASSCNLRCSMCMLGDSELRQAHGYRGRMSLATYHKLIDECAEHGCPSIGMNHINEPLLDRDVVDKIGYASNKGVIDIFMNTNGHYLTAELDQRLIASGLTRLQISIDAFSSETYSKIRKRGDYHKVVKNIHELLEVREKRNAKLPLIRVSFLVLEDNQGELEPFLDYWLTRADNVAVQSYLPPSRSDQHLSIKAHGPMSDDGALPGCIDPWQRLAIQGDGNTKPCCAHFSRVFDTGNVHERSIYDIWNGPVMKQLRQVHKRREFSQIPTCHDCLKDRFL